LRVDSPTKNQALLAFAALAHESRLDIFRRLVAAGPSGVRAGQLSEELDLPCPTLSFHLNELRKAGIVSSKKSGRQVIYTADVRAVESLGRFLTAACCGPGAQDA
jgi:DNA-binding transcriptional ArsR family regulator